MNENLLRFITCGSVDDGKSTLIGRLLYETNSIFEDQLSALKKDSEKFGTTGKEIDYALLVDGLAAEREQGITIDVAYRYFSTSQRHFIVADTPGHEQYTRNMATGASTAELAILLVDAQKGLLPQTKRHALIVSMVGVKHVILAVNKMDKVAYAQDIFEQIKADFKEFSQNLNFETITPIPLAAKLGENIVSKSDKMAWFNGKNLLATLETLSIKQEQNDEFMFPVQWVNRPHANFRGFAGTIAQGLIKVGDEVTILPLKTKNKIAQIHTPLGIVNEAHKGEAVTLTMERETDISRGSLITNAQIKSQTKLTAKLLWMGERPMNLGRYHIKLSTQETIARLNNLHHVLNIQTLETQEAQVLHLNDIGHVTLTLEKPLSFTPFTQNKELGAFILIDPLSHETVAMGMVEKEAAPKPQTLGKKIIGFFTPKGESHKRSLAKAITWRVTGSIDTFILSYIFTSNLKAAASISLAEIVTKIFLYYGHERLWNKVNYGKGADLKTEEKAQGFEFFTKRLKRVF